MRKIFINKQMKLRKSVSTGLAFLLLLCASMAFAQTGTVTGTVTDASGEPLIGVNVLVKGTAIGAITDFDGKYAIQQVPANAILVFSYIGFTSQELAVGNQRVINAQLREDTQRLDEVVVVGYGTQQRRDITGSVAVVDTKELLKSTGSSAVAQLQGKVSGVQIQTSGAAGGATTVRIRGVNTVNSNGPLYVIDGVSTRNSDLGMINPNDIESMQVLKDASSSAIYGAQAANGVILITTKRGIKTGQPVLTYDMYYGWANPGKRYDLVSGKERMEMEFKGQVNYLKNSGAWDSKGDRPYHELFKTTESGFVPYPYHRNVVGGVESIDMSQYYFGYPGLTVFTKYSDTKWWDEVTNSNAPIQNHQFGIRGGNDKGQYSASVNIYDQQSITKWQYYKRYSTRLNSSFNIRPWLRIGEDFAYSWRRDLGVANESSESTIYSWTYRASPWIPVYDEGGNFAGSSIPGTGNWQNPVALMYREKDNYWTNSRMNLSAWTEIDLYKGLMFTSRFGIEYTQNYHYRMSKMNLEYSESPRNNNLEERAGFTIRTVWSNTMTYKATFNNVHKVAALVGTEAIDDGIGRQLTGIRYNYMFENDINTWVLNMGDRNDQREANSEYRSRYALFGVFSRVDYTFKDKYLLTANIRRDGVSRFSKSNRYGVFPAVSVGWRLSEESFMSSTRDFLDNLMLRVGYGQVGNAEGPSATNWASDFAMSASNANYAINGSNQGSTAFRQNRIGNEDTKWEAIETLNVGLDASLLNGKFGVGLEFYKKNTTNMLIQAAYSNLAGEATAPYVNYGNMYNTGVDAALSYYDHKGDWKWNATLTLTHYKNEVGWMTPGNERFVLWRGGQRITNEGQINRTIKGRPMAEFYGYKVEGVYENVQQVFDRLPIGAPANMKSDEAQRYVGYFKFADINGTGNDGKPNGRITTDDRTELGSPHPDLIAGLNIGIEYKGFDFTMFWYSTVGNKIFNNANAFLDFQLFRGNRSTRMRDNSWEPGKTYNSKTLPMLNSGDGYSMQVCSYFVEDGSFLRMNNLVLGYTIPKSILQKATISNLRIYGQVENALTFTKYTGLNPDFNNRDSSEGNSRDLNKGVDVGGWPTVIRFLLGVNFAF